MVQVSVHAAKTNLSKLIEAVESGEWVVITRHGASAAELIRARKPRVPLEGLKASAPPTPGRRVRADGCGGVARLARAVTALLLNTGAFAMALNEAPRLPEGPRAMMV